MSDSLQLRKPTKEDGMAVHRLIANCPPLDTNSAYCNLLQCTHFADTSVIAEMQGEVVGFISGYRVPEAPTTLFIWQVAVGEKARGHGLAGRMLADICDRDGNRDLQAMQTTVTADNEASWALFEGFARRRGATLERSMMFDRDAHFKGSHDSELLASIAPLR